MDEYGAENIGRLKVGDVLDVVEGPLVLGIDEFNYLLPKCYGAPIDDIHGYALKGLVGALANTVISAPASAPLFPVFAGTTMVELGNIITDFSHSYTTVPLPLLDWSGLEEIVDGIDWLAGWRQCIPFRRCLAIAGGVPRLCEYFLMLCSEHAHRGVSMSLWPFSSIFADVVSVAKSKYVGSIGGYEGTLLRLTLLRVPVDREQRVTSDRESPTFGFLEERGAVILVQHGDLKTLHVDLPFILVRTLLQHPAILARQGYDPNLTSMLRELFRFESWSEELISVISPHDFDLKDFNALYEAARSWMLYDHMSLNLLRPVCSVQDFFGKDALYASNVTAQMEFKLEHMQQICIVEAAPSPTLPYHNASNYNELEISNRHSFVFVAGSGAPVDTFSHRRILDGEGGDGVEGGGGGDFIFATQMTRYQQASLSINLIKEQAQKAAESISQPHLLVIISTPHSDIISPHLTSPTTASSSVGLL
ncbi:hypothetical protein HK102_000670 [Quaeritorhiza haematococci]|nr:hypothetical protein HK102_000670 [Quaeritorhiza haematococci]